MSRPGRRATVLLGFAEAFAAIEATWSLQRAGFEVLAFARPGSKAALRHVKGVDIVSVPSPEEDAAATIAAVSALLTDRGVDVLLPLDDGSLWLSSQVDLGPAVVAGPDAAGVALALDKGAQVELARRVGLDVLPTTAFDDVTQVEVQDWPVIVKPVDAVRLDGNHLIRPKGRICLDADELRQAREDVTPGRVLVQALATGTGEGIFGFMDATGPAELSAHRRIRMMNPQGSASSACRSVPVAADLREPVVEFVTQAGWRGLFMIELLRDREGTAWFMEINGRAWGSLALARARGLEYPAWAVEAALGLPIAPAPPVDPPDVEARHLGRELAHLAFVLRGPQSDALTEWPRLWPSARQVLVPRRGVRLFNFGHRHGVVLASDTWRTLADLSGRLRR